MRRSQGLTLGDVNLKMVFIFNGLRAGVCGNLNQIFWFR